MTTCSPHSNRVYNPRMSTLPYNPVPITNPGIPVSPISIKTLLNWTPRIAAHIMLWFDPTSSSHLNIGYLSSDPTVVAQQVTYLKLRGVDFALLEWYGSTAHPHNEAALAWKAECEKQGLNFAIGLDGGMFKSWYMPSGTDVNTWAEKQVQYVADNFFTSPNYEKTPDGRYFSLQFGWELVSGLDQGALVSKFPKLALLCENTGGVSRPGSAGAFGWIGVNDANPQGAIEAYTSDFLSKTASSYAANNKLYIMGSICKGFDDHNRKPGGDPTKSCWDATRPYRFADEKHGQTFLNVIDLYNKSTFKPPYMQLVTFNDHEEGTEYEWGIDSLLDVKLSVSNGVLTATLTGNLNTVSHTDIVVNDKVAATFTGGSHTFDLNSLNPANNQQFQCQAVVTGIPFFQQKTSNVVTTTALVVPATTSQVPVNTTVTVPLSSSASVQLNTQVAVPISTEVDVPISTTINGLTVSGTVKVPISQTVQVPINQTVQVPVQSASVEVPISTTVTVTLTNKTTWQ